MPLMYRPGGVQKFFNSTDEGEKAGFFPSYSDVVAACEAAQNNGGESIESSSSVDVDGLSVEALRDLADAHGLDSSVHHKKLRRQVREFVNAQVRAD